MPLLVQWTSLARNALLFEASFHDAVPGIPLVDQAPHDLLGAPVRRRDRGMVLLQLDRNVRAAEEGMDEVAAQLGQLDHEIA